MIHTKPQRPQRHYNPVQLRPIPRTPRVAQRAHDTAGASRGRVCRRVASTSVTQRPPVLSSVSF